MNKEKLFIVSNYNSNCEWIKNYPYDYIIFDRSDTEQYIFDKQKTFKSPNVGHNIYDYLMYFYNYYDSLPEYCCLLKGNMFYLRNNNWIEYKYITKEKFDRVIHNKYYTCLTSWTYENGFNSLRSCDGAYLERNDVQNMINVKNSFNPPLSQKHYISYNNLLSFIFKNPIKPTYIHFSPGACYIVNKWQILKYPKIFWLNLTKFIDYNNNPIESHLMERMMHTLFNSDFEIQEYMKEELKI